MRLLATALGFALLASAAHAQVGIRPLRSPGFQPGIRYAVAGLALTGDCANNVSGLTRAFCLSPKDGSYSGDGSTAVASAAAAGANIPAGCSSSGKFTCTGTSVITFSTTLPANGWTVVVRASASTVAEYNAKLGTGSDYIDYYSSAGGNRQIAAGTASGNTDTGISSTARIAVCGYGSGVYYYSANGGAAVSASITATSTANDTLYIANNNSGSLPNSDGVLSVVGYNGCSQSAVQAASAN